MRIKGTTLRKIRDFIEWLVNVRPSHEIIRQWVNEVGEEYQKTRAIIDGSGVYCYDEEYLRIRGVRYYRLALVDTVTTETVNEKVVKELSKDNIKDFLVISLKGKKLLAIITDGNPEYDNILKDVTRELNMQEEILHQLCIFHALKNFSHAIHKAIKDIKRRKLGYTTDYKNLKNTIKLTFSLDNDKVTKKYLKRLPENHRKIFLKVIHDKGKSLREKARRIFDYIYRWYLNYHPYISQYILWIHTHWDNLTHFYEHRQIPKTNNIIEQHFSKTNPEIVKHTFKNPNGLENYLFAIAAYHNKELSLIT